MKTTPVAESSPRLPYTICMMLTAVPRSSEMPSWRRYVRARGVFHDANTAVIAPSSCSRGSSGKSRPVCSRLIERNSSTSSRSAAASRSTSPWTPRELFARVSASSNRSLGTPSTTLEYICTNRRYESAAKRSLPDARASPSTDRGFSPRFRIVSIIPGIDTGEPDRTETRSGSSGSPRLLPPQRSSRAARCLDTCRTGRRAMRRLPRGTRGRPRS